MDLYNEYVDAAQFSLETCWYKYNLRHKRYTKFELNRWRYTTSQGWSFENWHPNTGMQLATIKPGMVQIPWHHYFGNYQPQQESIPAVSCCTVRVCECVCVCVYKCFYVPVCVDLWVLQWVPVFACMIKYKRSCDMCKVYMCIYVYLSKCDHDWDRVFCTRVCVCVCVLMCVWKIGQE